MDFSQTPVATIIFIFTIVISVYALYFKQSIIEKGVLRPYLIVRGKNLGSLIYNGFLHANGMHLLFNMITFYFFAFQLEKTIGSLNFFILYFASMIVSDIPSIIQYRDDPEYASLGASGAISGIVFSMILFYPFSGLYVFPIPFPLPAFVFGILYLIWSYYSAKHSEDIINHSAHFWGAIAGIITTIILEPRSILIFINSF
ncbi:MAG TPA: rhomboid family intramembrane serine protease [Candidatus Kapabacteria bacterium]|jgi:membrane associated rhomboid family serine protease|nr:rhomboid family intramembrane serine protease [Candidatus Kapabacteria bacterium]HOV91878.1 rhomboid family intramembrane serine protease [Candidatus Kapabacteria bacterium]